MARPEEEITFVQEDGSVVLRTSKKEAFDDVEAALIEKEKDIRHIKKFAVIRAIATVGLLGGVIMVLSKVNMDKVAVVGMGAIAAGVAIFSIIDPLDRLLGKEHLTVSLVENQINAIKGSAKKNVPPSPPLS